MRDEEILIPIVAIGGPLLLIAYNITAKTLSRVVCHWRDTSLKIRLAESGFSPSEIEKVVIAGTRDSHRRPQYGNSAQVRSRHDEKPPIHLESNRADQAKGSVKQEVAL